MPRRTSGRAARACIVMRGPDGKEIPIRGVYLEVVENERLVFTDAYTKAWEPSAKPFMTGDRHVRGRGGGKTRYTARARHWTAEDREAHEKMGFHEGWGRCADQLAALAKKICAFPAQRGGPPHGGRRPTQTQTTPAIPKSNLITTSEGPARQGRQARAVALRAGQRDLRPRATTEARRVGGCEQRD